MICPKFIDLQQSAGSKISFFQAQFFATLFVEPSRASEFVQNYAVDSQNSRKNTSKHATHMKKGMMVNLNENPETQVSLIARMRDAGDEDAWAEFIQIYQPLVQRFIQRHGLQYADAAEVTQEVLSRVAKSIESWEESHEKSTFRGWLYRITRNLTIDFLRKKKIEGMRIENGDAGLSQVADPSEATSDDFQAEFEKQIFHWASEKLKPSFKPTNWEAFWLSTVDGQPIDEVAKRLDIDVGTIYVARSRIMARLSQLIQDRLDDTRT